MTTIRRRREQLIELGATVDPSGWSIPIPALVTVGLLDRVSPPERGIDHPSDTPTDHPPVLPVEPRQENELDELRQLLAVERARREAAEAVATERAHALNDLRAALRMIEAAQPKPSATEDVAPSVAPVQPEQETSAPEVPAQDMQPRKWWDRIFGR